MKRAEFLLTQQTLFGVSSLLESAMLIEVHERIDFGLQGADTFELRADDFHG